MIRLLFPIFILFTSTLSVVGMEEGCTNAVCGLYCRADGHCYSNHSCNSIGAACDQENQIHHQIHHHGLDNLKHFQGHSSIQTTAESPHKNSPASKPLHHHTHHHSHHHLLDPRHLQGHGLGLEDGCMARPPLEEEKYLVVLSAREQANKNVVVIAEYASWAKELGRTLVAPLMCDSRIVPPFDSLAAAGMKLTGALAAAPKGKTSAFMSPHDCHSGSKVEMMVYWDLHRVCNAVPMVSWAEWLKLTEQDQLIRDNFVLHIHGATKNHKPSNREAGSSRTLYVGNYMRDPKISKLIGAGMCTIQPCFGNFVFQRSPVIAAYAQKIKETVGHYTCVQWRSEMPDSTVPKRVEKCAQKLLDVIQSAWSREGVDQANQLTMLVTDLYPGTSSTYIRKEPAFKALEMVERGLGIPKETQGVGGGSSVERGVLYNATAHLLRDHGLAGLLQQDLCAIADVVVMCVHYTHCPDCGMSHGSGFSNGILRMREHYNKSSQINRVRGVWSWSMLNEK